MHQPQQRASRLRVVALASTVALAVALPLAAAVAGEDARIAAEAAQESRQHTDATASGAPLAQSPSAAGSSDASNSVVRGQREPHSGREEDSKSLVRPDVPRGAGALGNVRSASSCGPEITSPEGVEAQTCVVTERRDTWARTYYRNATNSALTAVLTLMRPDGHTIQVHCAMPAADEPGMCETPRRTTVGPEESGSGEPYSAVAEVAPADGARVLLRAGNNTAANHGS